jgi:hypothetical protein
MPIRINIYRQFPSHFWNPFKLNFESIKKIIELTKDFSSISCTADDDNWGISSEPPESFLAAIENRRKLDGLRIICNNESPIRKVEIVFNKYGAKVALETDDGSQEYWFNHFIFDFNRLLLSPNPLEWLQMLVKGQKCIMVFSKSSLNPFLENVAAGVISNFIWFLITLFAYFLGLMTPSILQFLRSIILR